jgi:hypothetical protein
MAVPSSAHVASSSAADITTAPHPSPNRMQVPAHATQAYRGHIAAGLNQMTATARLASTAKTHKGCVHVCKHVTNATHAVRPPQHQHGLHRLACMYQLAAPPPRSFQSTKRDSASPPTSSTRRAAPVRTYCAPVIRPSTKPLHAAVRSKAHAFLAPMAACNCGCSQHLNQLCHTVCHAT